VKVIRRIGVLAVIALLWWLFAVGKLVAVGSTDGQLPLAILTGLLIALAFWIQGSGRATHEYAAPPEFIEGAAASRDFLRRSEIQWDHEAGGVAPRQRA
jgi:hypothetical protein